MNDDSKRVYAFKNSKGSQKTMSEYKIKRKRRLIDEFEAMSLEEEIDDQSDETNEGLKLDSDCYTPMSDYLMSCKSRKRHRKQLSNNSLDDFSEIRSTLEDENFNKNKSGDSTKKKRNKKQDNIEAEENEVATKGSFKFEKKVLSFILEKQEMFPKIYSKISKLYDSYVTSTNLINSFKNLPNNRKENEPKILIQPEGGKQIIDKFIKKMNSCMLNTNSKITKNLMIRALKELEEDYEMDSDGDSYSTVCIYYQPAPLAITDSS